MDDTILTGVVRHRDGYSTVDLILFPATNLPPFLSFVKELRYRGTLCKRQEAG